MKINGFVKLFDITEDQSIETGVIIKTPLKVTSISAEISPVGANTYWQGSSEKTELIYTVQVQSRSYKDQKYIAFKDRAGTMKIYQIHNVAKGESLQYLKLNCKVTQENLEELIAYVI